VAGKLAVPDLKVGAADRTGARGACPSVSGAPGGSVIRAPVYLEHSIQDAWEDLSGKCRVVFKRMQSAEIDSDGKVHNVGYAPYLD
jgi:hypothetical protein